jgi:4-amino-4-deoxy-L-arabinose transferase-like glycosyltransferase
MSVAMPSAPSAKSFRSGPRTDTPPFSARDALLLAAIAGLALLLMSRAGARRGVELMPWPDGLEYAAAAVNVERGLGPVLHFGGYSYPSRYTAGYPLLLAAGYPIVGREVARLRYVTMALGVLALMGMCVLARRYFGRASAFFAGLILATSPLFITYSTLVMSDVPTLALTVVAALALGRAAESEHSGGRGMWGWWAVGGLLAGFTVIIRPTNAALLAGVAVALWMVPPAGAGLGIGRIALSLLGFAAAFSVAPALQAFENASRLGAVLASGYDWWVPEVYAEAQATFNVKFLFGATMPRNPYGNAPVYFLSLLGLDGLLAGEAGPKFYLYPFAAAAFAAVGAGAMLRTPGHRPARRVVGFGLGFLGALLAVYLFYFFTEIAFLLPAAFVLFVSAGYGIVVANRWLADVYAQRVRSAKEMSGMMGVLALDLLLAASLISVVSARLEVRGRDSQVLPELSAAAAAIEPDAIVVSNVSLQFLELYASAPGRSFAGFTTTDPGEELTDYHLARLYAKRSAGWNGAVPPALFDGDVMAAEVGESLQAQARAGRPLYVLLATPRSAAYARALERGLDELSRRFELEPVVRGDTLVLMRLGPR